MRLLNLITCLEYALIQTEIPVQKMEISGISYDSRNVKKGEIFVCLRGYKSDGHLHIREAAQNGAAAVMIEVLAIAGKVLDFPENMTVLLVKDTREALAYLSAAWFRWPAKKLTVIGVTGTKGKTTVAWLVKSMLEALGEPCGYIGTLGAVVGETSFSEKNTTPESFTIHKYFAKMVEAGCKYAIIEVSSQAMKYKRAEGIEFAAGIFTNFGEDHIGPGEHESMEEYLYCKSLLFRQCRIGIGNVDDAAYDRMFADVDCERYGFGITTVKQKQILRAEDIRFLMQDGCPVTRFKAGEETYTLAMPGMFNVYNALAALQTIFCLRLEEATGGDVLKMKLKAALSQASVRGRMERVDSGKNIACYIDYAHNAMSLRNVLETLRVYRPHRIITVFGCGGNRAKGRRTQMGKVSGELADLTIITSDNPRFELPRQIMADIEEGLLATPGSYQLVEDRGEAIALAVRMAKPGDIILVAGKGHEDYQEIQGKRYPMDDRILLREAWSS